MSYNPIYGRTSSGVLVPVQVDANGSLLLGNAGALIGQVRLEDGSSTTLAKVDSNLALWVAQTLGGAVLSDTNPEPNISNIQQMILNGKSFSCSTDFVTAAAGMAGEFFIPNTNAKNIIIWSVRVAYTNATQFAYVRYITAVDATIDAGTSVIGNALNLKGGGAAPASGATFKYASGVAVPAISASSLPIGGDNTAPNATSELFAPGEFRFIPPTTAGGI
ncbi:MAG TPA: hypothetical protein VKX46_01550, partial [Ktedonobacteraceae bacterium]|nr:hypothetical protein [Ktedonobacteraceae bacterium]